MENFVRFTGKAAPLLLDNIDTDQIIPGGGIFDSGEITREQCGRTLFADWRYLPDGNENPDFILNQPRWRDATILLAGHNFGCGSSREWATTALRGFGFRVVIAAGFSNIFFNNCFRNGVLPVALAHEQIRLLGQQMLAFEVNEQLTVDLEQQRIWNSAGFECLFQVPPVMRRMLLDGATESDYAVRYTREIEAFRMRDHAERPWVHITSNLTREQR